MDHKNLDTEAPGYMYNNFTGSIDLTQGKFISAAEYDIFIKYSNENKLKQCVSTWMNHINIMFSEKKDNTK